MLTELQTIFLTCLLGPEDTGAFKRLQNAEKARGFRARRPGYYKAKRLADLENARQVSRTSKKKARQDPLFRAYEQAQNREWVKNNPEKSRASQRNARAAQKKRNPACKIAGNLRSRLNQLLKGRSKSASSLGLLGCSIEQWRVYLESQFKPGMTWENYGQWGWHIDHIKPCAKFDLTDPAQQRACFHWSNTQPLFFEENLKKGQKYVG